jgi:hypothetical protein
VVNQFENLRSSRYEAFLATQGIKLLNSPISEHGLLENSNSLCACDVACMHRITSVVEATTRVLQLAMADMSGIVRMSETHIKMALLFDGNSQPTDLAEMTRTRRHEMSLLSARLTLSSSSAAQPC